MSGLQLLGFPYYTVESSALTFLKRLAWSITPRSAPIHGKKPSASPVQQPNADMGPGAKFRASVVLR